jgi:hypothetical protein
LSSPASGTGASTTVLLSGTNATIGRPARSDTPASQPGASTSDVQYPSPLSTIRTMLLPAGSSSSANRSAMRARFSRAAANTSSADTPHGPSRSCVTYAIESGRSTTTISRRYGRAGRDSGGTMPVMPT